VTGPRLGLGPGRRGVTIAVAGLLALAGCGVPRDDTPRAVPAGQVDPRLLAEPSVTGTPTPTGSSAYMVAFVTPDDTLQLRSRAVSPGTPAEQAQQLLVELARGPDDAEHAHGLSTALPSDATLTLTTLDQGVAVVAIDTGTKDAEPRRLPLSVAQVVLTLTSHPDVHSVSITSDGQPVEAPLTDGFVVNRPLTAADYRSLLAGRAKPSPTRSR
jgi:spore germination protein GerM